LIGIGPLAIFLLTLRHGAPTRPALAGAVSGLLAGGIAATFFAAQCTNDSPLYVATWYTIGIAGLALIGAVGAKRIVRW
ncbi:MAG: NrsF family protein, partial [Methyloceanibacter sp.]